MAPVGASGADVMGRLRSLDGIDRFAATLIALGLLLLAGDAGLWPTTWIDPVFRGGVEEWAPSFLLDGMLLGVVNRILRRQERTRVLSQISSLSREFALDATRRARDEGWLYDGSLCERGLSRASLQGADLANVRFAGADLTFADLADTILAYADLREADLTGADLRGADLRWADLSNARLGWADLRGALLDGTRLDGVDARYAAVDPGRVAMPAFREAVPGGFLDPEQVDEIRRTFEQFTGMGPEAGRRFYLKLFEAAPETRAMFRSDPTEQGKKFMHMLGVIVSALHSPTRHVAVLRSLGERHRGYGVAADHYTLVGNALIAVLEESLGPSFTPSARAAWERAFELIAVLMDGTGADCVDGETRPRIPDPAAPIAASA